MADVPTIIAAVAGIASVGSAVGSAISASNSGRSATAAEKSADASIKALHRTAVRDLIMLCHETLIEASRIESLAIDVRSTTTTLFNTPGNWGSSRHTQAKGSLEKDVKNVAEKSAEARSVIESAGSLYTESTIEVNQKSTRVVAARDELRVVRESMERHLAGMRASIASRAGGKD